MNKKQRLFLSVTLSIVVVLAVGIAIPKLTVRDMVSVDEDFRNSVVQAVSTHYDNPFERLALWLGKSRIVSAESLNAEVESFTLFRIPLGLLRGIPGMKLGIFFNPAGDWSAKITSDVIGFESDEQTEEGDLWQTFIDQEQNIRFKYPRELTAEYMTAVDWPPVVMVSLGHQLTCQETPPESSLPHRIMRRQVDDRVYCVEALSEGVAGFVYTQYSYSTVWNEKIVTINFTLQFPPCYNYDEPSRTDCKKEREFFDLNVVVDRIVSSLQNLSE